MALVEQLGNDSRWWYVPFAAIWHWYLPLCSYIMVLNVIVSVHSFFMHV